MFLRGCFQSEDGVHLGREEKNMMEGWIFIVQYQRKPLLNDELELPKMMFLRGCCIIQQSEDGVHLGREEKNMMEGWSFNLGDRRMFGFLRKIPSSGILWGH